MPPVLGLVTLGVVGAALATGCGVASGADRVTLSVLADSSYGDAFGRLGPLYQRSHPGVTITFTYEGSQDAASQAGDPAPADVLATADDQTMVLAAHDITGRRVVARTGLTIAVTPGNPRHLRGLSDLATPGLRVVLGGPDVPVGRYTQRVLTAAGVRVTPVSEEADARTALTKVRTGQADAAIVFLTDLPSAGASASGVPIPLSQNAVANFDVAVMRRAAHGGAARSFVSWLGSPAARRVLAGCGFTSP